MFLCYTNGKNGDYVVALSLNYYTSQTSQQSKLYAMVNKIAGQLHSVVLSWFYGNGMGCAAFETDGMRAFPKINYILKSWIKLKN